MSGDTGVRTPEEPSQRESVYVIGKPFLLADLANILKLPARGERIAIGPLERERQLSRLDSFR